MVQNYFLMESLRKPQFCRTFPDFSLILQVLSFVIECGCCEPKCAYRTIVLLVTE